VNSVIFVPAVRDYAEAVRRELAGLSPEQVRDLTDDLEMDLTDALADSGDQNSGASDALTLKRIAERFGDPRLYADELRAAADLPPRAGGSAPAAGGDPVPSPPSVVQRSFEELRAAALRWGRTRWWRGAVWVGRKMRPVWWVIRALAVLVLGYEALDGQGTDDLVKVIVFCVVIAASMALGQVPWGERPRRTRVLLAAFNTVAVIVTVWAALMLFVGNWSFPASGGAYAQEPYGKTAEADYCSEQLCFGGVPVRNIFAFDAEGRPLEHVQLFDQNGKPLNISTDLGWTDGPGIEQAEDGLVVMWFDPDSPLDNPELWSTYKAPNGDFYAALPARSKNGDLLWNVFPLAAHQWRFDNEAGGWRQVDAGQPAAVPPFGGKPEQVDVGSSEPPDKAEEGGEVNPEPSASAEGGSSAPE
jgi:hypothetical protein